MTEQEIITKIQQLRQIKPNRNWVISIKKEIFKEETFSPSFVSTIVDVIKKEFVFLFQHKPAFAVLAGFLVLIGTLGFAQGSVPGDLLYSLRKITEQGQRAFVSSEEEFNIQIVNNRIADLNRIIQNNSTRNLAPAINEYQASVSQVARNITKDEIKKNPAELKKIVKEVKNIERKTAEIKSLGIQIDENIELDGALIQLISLQVEELEKKILTEDQLKIVEEIKSNIETGKYSEALEKILLLNQNN